MENKFYCLDFCNGELMEEKEYLLLKDALKFYVKAEDPIIIYGIRLFKEKE